MEFALEALCTIALLWTVNCHACRCVEKPLHEAFCDADFGKRYLRVRLLRSVKHDLKLLSEDCRTAFWNAVGSIRFTLFARWYHQHQSNYFFICQDRSQQFLRLLFILIAMNFRSVKVQIWIFHEGALWELRYSFATSLLRLQMHTWKQ